MKGFYKISLMGILLPILSLMLLSNFCWKLNIIEVPEKIQFAGIELRLNQGVKRQVEEQIKVLLQNQPQIQNNLYQIQLYLKAIEDILNQEGLPTDLKYLAIQDNILLSGTMSSSSGFWQLKEDLAQEMGIIVNDNVDERLNLVNSTKGVSQYVRRSNLYFKNWLFSLLSIKLGFENAKNLTLQNYNRSEIVGAQSIQLTEHTHPYIRNFLAYKLLLENLISENVHLKLKLVQYTKGANKTLPQIAKKFHLSSAELLKHNKWLKKKRIPSDKIYPVVIPQYSDEPEIVITKPIYIAPIPPKEEPLSEKEFIKGEDLETQNKNNDFNPLNTSTDYPDAEKTAIIQEESKTFTPSNNPIQESDVPDFHTVVEGNTLFSIVRMYPGTSVTEIRILNNLKNNSLIYPGQVLRLKEINFNQPEKQNTDNQGVKTHTVQVNETLYSIAQKYNLSIGNLRIWNNLSVETPLKIGQKLIIENKNNLKPNLRSPNTPLKGFLQKIFKSNITRKLAETPNEGPMRGAMLPRKNRNKKELSEKLTEPEIKK